MATHDPPLHTLPELVQSVQAPPPVPQAAFTSGPAQAALETQQVLQLEGPHGVLPSDPLPPLEDVDEDVLPPLEDIGPPDEDDDELPPLLPPTPLLLVPLPDDELDEDPRDPVPELLPPAPTTPESMAAVCAT